MKYKFDDIAYNITQKRAPQKEDSLKYIGLEHLDSGSLTVNRYGLDVDLKGDKLVMTKGDVLLGKRNAYLRRAAIAPHDGLFSAHGMILRPKENVIDKDFFPFFIASDYFFDEVIRISVGGLSPTVNWRDLKELEFNLPSLSEQKVLADKLWAAYEVKQSYLKMIEATQGMVKSQFIEMFKEVSHKVTLENVVNIKDDCRKPINDSVRSTMKSGELYPYYGATGVVDYVNDYITNEQLLCIAEDCGNYRAGEESSYIIDGKAWVNNHAHVVKPKDTCSIEYLHQYLKMQNLMPYVSGTTRLKLTQKKLKEIPVILPDKERQMEFVAITKQADKSEFELRKSIKAIDAVIKSLINS